RILVPGWHITSPLTPTRILALEGEGALPPLPVGNREGVRAEALLSFHYSANLEALARASRDRRLGFHPLLEQAAASAIAELTAARSASELLDRTALDAPLASAISGRMSEVGLEISSLKWEIRLPEEFRVSTLRSQARALAQPTGVRVLLIGLDAADWESINPLLDQGRLPHLKALLDRGIRGPLRSYNPMVSPLLWTTVVTGKGPDVHGVADFSVVEAKTGAKVPISSRYRNVKAIWNILSDLDRSTAVVGWWASYPADHIKGVMVTDRVAALSMLPNRERLASGPGYTYPSETLSSLLPDFSRPAEISLEELRTFAPVTPEEYRRGLDWIAHPPAAPEGAKGKPPVQDPVGLLLKILTAARNYQAAGLDILGRGPFDLTAIYFEGIDLVGHRFQHYRPPKMQMVNSQEYAEFHSVVTAYYIYQDRLLGELVKKAGAGTTVMVISDHGFKTGDRRPEGVLPYTVDQPVEWHREDGIFILSGPAAARGVLPGRADLFDIAPTLLALLGAPVPTDMPGRVLSGALDPDFLKKYPPASIPTYEGMGEERQTEAEGDSEEVSAEMMAQLRALGYVGADASPPKKGPAAPAGAPDEMEDTTVSYHRNLATYYLSRREYDKAIQELDRANLREKLPKSYAMQAEAFDALGRKREALAALQEGWKAVPEAMAVDSILWYVQLAVDLGDAAGGRRFLEGYSSRLEEAPAVKAACEGVLAEAAGNIPQAQRLYQAALSSDPTLVAAARPLAALYSKEGKLEALRPILEAGLKKSERIDEYHNLLGVLDSRDGNKEAALAHFRRAVELNPVDPRFALNLGLTLMDLRRWQEASSVLEKAAAVSPDGNLLLALGNARLSLGQAEQALLAFQSAARLGSDPTRTDLGTALSYVALKRRDEALSFLRQRLASRPNDAPLQRLYQDIQAHP
ncbi:MAG: alkaline phosphatase family protein, partial [Acidobacteria bacterium]|nr:alkaline phosphatase family protein [Acidobacteriota bacterium]